ncbi:MAG: hypothetical protein WCF90_01885 [Methanomicrobiales archaeon]
MIFALAAALVQHPTLLIFDECDSHLDSCCEQMIDRLIREFPISNVIRITQDMEAATVCDCAVFLEDGLIRHSGRPKQVFAGL